MSAIIVFNTLGSNGGKLTLEVTEDYEHLGNALAAGRWPAVTRRGTDQACRINPQTVAYIATDPRDDEAGRGGQEPAAEEKPFVPPGNRGKTIMGDILNERS